MCRARNCSRSRRPLPPKASRPKTHPPRNDRNHFAYSLTGRKKIMNYKTTIHYGLAEIVICCAMSVGIDRVSAQETAKQKTSTAQKSGRDPFRKFEPIIKTRATTTLTPPTIQERIERYRGQKMAAANAHVPAPKPTTALLLSEMQVIGIFRTPRGWAAMVEATPIKLSYVVYPGEAFFDGQLVAIEETRLVFRRETVFADGRHEKSVEVKPLRQPSTVQTMAATPTATANNSAPEPGKPGTPEKQ